MRPSLALLLVALMAVAGCRRDEAPAADAARPSIPFRLDGTLRFLRADGTPITGLSIEIADNDSSRTRGLMERDSIPAQVGMLFLMPRTEPQTFWMANTPHSLDIYFVGQDSTVINVAKYTTPFSAQGVASTGPARYVVETAAGFADLHGIGPGDRIVWSRNPSPTAAYVGGIGPAGVPDPAPPAAAPTPAAETEERADSEAAQ